MFVAWKVGEPVTMMQYIRKTMLQYQKEWLNGLTLTTWAQNENNEAGRNAPLRPLRRRRDIDEPKEFHQLTELGTRFVSPRASVPITDERVRTRFSTSRKTLPVFKLSHQMGLKNVLGATSTTTIRRSAPRNGSGSLPSDISTPW